MQKSILETNVFDTVVNFLHILAALITRKAFSKDEIYADISSKGKKDWEERERRKLVGIQTKQLD